jgi:hypothetical protein
MHTPWKRLYNRIFSFPNLHHGGMDEADERIMRFDFMPIGYVENKSRCCPKWGMVRSK